MEVEALHAYRILVNEKVLQQQMFYKNQVIMTYTIKYPYFISTAFQTILNKLNSFYKTKAIMYERSNIMNLYQMAMVEYEYSKTNNFPIRQFEAFVDYKVTYNESCTLSLYFDQYEYTGGAHGLTIRYSDTWDLLRSRKMEVNELFKSELNYQDFIYQEIIQDIEGKVGSEEYMYFDDYKKLVKDKFKPNNFYLDKEGIVIFYQAYDIAPYASGIPTFTIPYKISFAIEPNC